MLGMRNPSTWQCRLAGLNHLGSFRKNSFSIRPTLDIEYPVSLGNTLFSVLTGAIIWVRFEKQTPMIEGEEDRPATGSHRPRRGRFCHLRPRSVPPPPRGLPPPWAFPCNPWIVSGCPWGPPAGLPWLAWRRSSLQGGRYSDVLYHVKRNLLFCCVGGLCEWAASPASAGSFPCAA